MPMIEYSDSPEKLRSFLKDTKGWVQTPGLVDLQVNGFAGVDFNSPDLTQEAFDNALRAILQTGVTRILPTVITGRTEHMQACFSALEKARTASALAQTIVSGYHLEGPFLSPSTGYSGCHPVEAMCEADSEVFARLQECAGGNIRLVTLAPEIKGALQLIEKLVQDGIIVAIGHSAAEHETIQKAVTAGALLSTHLGNGTAPELHKSNNPIMSQLSEDRLSACFIADGYHLSPEILQVYVRAKESGRTILVTDATSGATASPGNYRLGTLDLKLGPEPVVYDPVTSRPVGSAVTLDQCVRNVMNWFGVSLDEAVSWAADNPLSLLNKSKIQPFPPLGEEAVWWGSVDGIWYVRAAHSGRFLVQL